MECPHCHNQLPSQPCPACQKETPAVGPYCCHCGSAIPESHGNGAADNEDGFSDRVLCSDGTCIGVINKDGVCSACGKPYTGESE